MLVLEPTAIYNILRRGGTIPDPILNRLYTGLGGRGYARSSLVPRLSGRARGPGYEAMLDHTLLSFRAIIIKTIEMYSTSMHSVPTRSNDSARVY